MQGIIVDDRRFWKAIKYCMKVVLPLVKVLRPAEGDAKPAMGYIYKAMDRGQGRNCKECGPCEACRYEKI